MGTDDTTNLTLHILSEIRDEAKATNERLDATNERLAGLETAFVGFRDVMDERLTNLARVTRGGFAAVNERIDNLLLGPHREEHLELRERIERIEAQLGVPEPAV